MSMSTGGDDCTCFAKYTPPSHKAFESRLWINGTLYSYTLSGPHRSFSSSLYSLESYLLSRQSSQLGPLFKVWKLLLKLCSYKCSGRDPNTAVAPLALGRSHRQSHTYLCRVFLQRIPIIHNLHEDISVKDYSHSTSYIYLRAHDSNSKISQARTMDSK